jgi:hypothetical protein
LRIVEPSYGCKPFAIYDLGRTLHTEAQFIMDDSIRSISPNALDNCR